MGKKLTFSSAVGNEKEGRADSIALATRKKRGCNGGFKIGAKKE